MNEKVILHADINNFYASVAILSNPALKGHPVVVCGDKEKRHGIVLAKCNLAKKAGIKTGDTVGEAMQKIEKLVIVPPDYKKYTEFSHKIFDIYTQYTPLVEGFGLDECWLDVTGRMKEYGSGEKLADIIRARVTKETGLTVSVGVSFSKIFAKLGSDMKKPDATVVISRENYREKVFPLPVSDLLYVGKSTGEKLNKMGIYNIGDLALADKHMLKQIFGKAGESIHDSANGIDESSVKQYTEGRIPKSVGNGVTASEDICNMKDLTSLVYSLCEVIGFRLRAYKLVCGSVSVNLRDANLISITRQAPLISDTAGSQEIAAAAIKLIGSNYDFAWQSPLRTVTVSVSNLLSAAEFMQETFLDSGGKKRNIEKNIDVLRKKYGFGVLKRAVTIGTVFIADSREIDDDFIPFEKHTKK